MIRSFAFFMIAIAAAATALPARAASPVALDGNVRVERTVIENGAEKTVLVAPDVVVPGDRLLFTTIYRNEGQAAVDNFVVTSPVPVAVIVSDDPAAPLDVSVDGGKTWGKLADLSVAQGDGTFRAATAADVTHVRWTIRTIAPGATGSVRYRATVR